jgi:hypothetical protein
MAWYDTGTVSVTNGSATVTGSGTNFIAGAQVGEGFASSDGRLYEIQAIVSATSLTLADPYLGSTQTGQDYKIVPTQSLVANLASQVSTLISDFQSVADEAGEGKFDDGSAASAGITFTLDQNTGFFRPADNQIGFSTAGVQRALLSSTALTLNVPFSGTTGTFSGNLTAGGDVLFQEKISMSGGSRGSVQIGSPNAVGGISERPVSYGNNLLAINDPSDTTASIWSQPSTNIGGAALVMTADNGDFGSFQFFATQDQDIATSVVERMRIDSSGLVGIGILIPAEPLHVVGTVRSDVSSTGDFNFAAYSTGGGQYRIYPDDATTANPTWLHQSNSSEDQAWVIGGVERMRITSTGLVGIGAENPAATFHVDAGLANLVGLFESTDAGATITLIDNSTTGGSVAEHGLNTVGNQLEIRAVDNLSFETSGDERLHIDSSGNVGIGTIPAYVLDVQNTGDTVLRVKANSSGAGNDDDAILRLDSAETGEGLIDFFHQGVSEAGIEWASSLKQLNIKTAAGTDGVIDLQPNDNVAVRVQDPTSNGLIMGFYGEAGNYSGGIGHQDNDLWIGEGAVGLQFQLSGDDRIDPFDTGTNSVRDNAIDLGGLNSRFDDIYATNGTIQTSDRNEKQDIEALSEAEQRVAVACKGLLRKFRWKDAVAERGDDARIHFGIIAQDLQAAFEAEGLDAGRYAMFISSTWTDKETGEERSRMGVRYPQLLAFIIAAI